MARLGGGVEGWKGQGELIRRAGWTYRHSSVPVYDDIDEFMISLDM